jgi:hypothetical protein
MRLLEALQRGLAVGTPDPVDAAAVNPSLSQPVLDHLHCGGWYRLHVGKWRWAWLRNRWEAWQQRETGREDHRIPHETLSYRPLTA